LIQSSDIIMRSFANSAAIAIVNEMTIKKIVNITVHEMVYNTIAKTTRKDFPLDRIGNNEADTRSDFVRSCAKFLM